MKRKHLWQAFVKTTQERRSTERWSADKTAGHRWAFSWQDALLILTDIAIYLKRHKEHWPSRLATPRLSNRLTHSFQNKTNSITCPMGFCEAPIRIVSTARCSWPTRANTLPQMVNVEDSKCFAFLHKTCKRNHGNDSKEHTIFW